jgi:hypothetical protein
LGVVNCEGSVNGRVVISTTPGEEHTNTCEDRKCGHNVKSVFEKFCTSSLGFISRAVDVLLRGVETGHKGSFGLLGVRMYMPMSLVEMRYRVEDRTKAMSKESRGCNERSVMVIGLVSYL